MPCQHLNEKKKKFINFNEKNIGELKTKKIKSK